MEEEGPRPAKRVKKRRGGTRKRTECRASEFITPSEFKVTVGDNDRSNVVEIAADDSDDLAVGDSQLLDPDTATWDIFEWNWSKLPAASDFPADVSSDSATAQSLTLSGADFQLPTQLPTVPLTPEMVYLLNEYRQGVATWMDVFDRKKTYQRELSQRAMTSELLLKSICAFTARQLSLLAAGEVWTATATRYYTQSLNLLIREMSNATATEDMLSATVILSSYEVLAAQGQEHRRHYEGALRLITMQGINAQSSGTNNANFWIWVRHEISVAIGNKTTLQMDPKQWKVRWRPGELDEDLLGGQILWLTARAVNWTYGNGTSNEYYDLLKDMERWYNSVPHAFRGIKYGNPGADGLTKVHFAIPAAGLAMTWYHALHILLYAEPMLRDASDALEVQEHATEIINISISDQPPGVRCFSILPLFFAGKHAGNVARKTRVWILLENIQRDIGYHTKSLTRMLQQMLDKSD